MKNTKHIFTVLIISTLIFAGFVGNVFADDDEASATGLDLHAVGELFRDSDNLEHFEKSLNAPENGINNLDLDENGEIDYIRVEEAVDGDTHLIVMQTQFAADDMQDVATIAVEEESADNYAMQIQGDPRIYGENYYVVPAAENIGSWKVVSWIYRPAYRPYRSAFGWRAYPNWWRVRRPVTVDVYRTRTVNYVGRRKFAATKAVRVKSAAKINYRPRASTVVRKNKRNARNGNTTLVKGGVKKTGADGTTVKKGVKKTTITKNGTKTKTKVKVKRNRN